MRKSSNAISGSLIAVLILFLSSSSVIAQLPQRVISIAGLVVNAETLTPIGSAQIFDANGSKLGVTDKNGYYKIDLNMLQGGEIYFKLRIVKQGFRDLTQTEHWGNLDHVQKIMYFGLTESRSASKSFSSFGDLNQNNYDLAYNNVLSHFGKIKQERDFDNKIESAKAGNENVLVQVDGKYYIVDSGGWIQLGSDKDLVSIDNKQVVSADKLNGVVKRRNVAGMTPIGSKDAKFLIHTR